jgi:hypothetical protein
LETTKVVAMKKSVVGRLAAVVVTVAALAFTPAYAGKDAQKVLADRAIERAPVTELAPVGPSLLFFMATPGEKEDVAFAPVEVIVTERSPVAPTTVARTATGPPPLVPKAGEPSRSKLRQIDFRVPAPLGVRIGLES